MASPVRTLPKVEDESFSFAMQLAMGSVLPMAMQAAIELDIFEIIGKAGPGAKLSAMDIATQITTQNPFAAVMIDRILRLLAGHGVLGCSLKLDADQETQRRLYSLVSVSKHFVRNEDGFSLGPLLVMFHQKPYLESWAALKDAVLEGGIPFSKVHGMHVYEYPQGDPRFGQIFNTGMINHTQIVMKKFLETYKGFEKIEQLVDVGGGFGIALDLITTRYPHIKIIQLEFIIGVEHVQGDMFHSVPAGDAIFMKWILHNWSDSDCLKLLKNCCKAIPSDGKVIVMDAVLSEMLENSAAARDTVHMDVFMLTQNHGGKKRTEKGFIDLAIAAGFSGVRFVCCFYNFWVMEFFN